MEEKLLYDIDLIPIIYMNIIKLWEGIALIVYVID